MQGVATATFTTFIFHRLHSIFTPPPGPCVYAYVISYHISPHTHDIFLFRNLCLHTDLVTEHSSFTFLS